MKLYQVEYPAVRVESSSEGSPIVLFAAPCLDIKYWSGIPQKKIEGGAGDTETIGFQRKDNPQRVKAIAKFFANPLNIIQNPILCASRRIAGGGVDFVPDASGGQGVQTGKVIISRPLYESMSIEELFKLLRETIENRVPRLKSETPSTDLIEKFKKNLRSVQELSSEYPQNVDGDLDVVETEDTASESDQGSVEPSEDASSVFFEETHLKDFWEEIAARHEVLKEIKGYDKLEFLGIGRDLLIDYLNPSVVVDGQHRLLGAIEHAKIESNSDKYIPEIEKKLGEGKNANQIADEMQRRVARVIPISMLLNDNPSEQVFQFVVVNQTATKLSRDLLGTIVSTTLEDDELPPIRDRLESAGVRLKESKVISFVARTEGSAFYKKISRGIDGNANELLAWDVAGSLISIFRELNGGVLWGGKNDYARLWANNCLLDSEIIPKDIRDKQSLEEALRFWADERGPWWLVFNKFWNEIKKFFASDDSSAFNYWGSPRTSNLFNKVSLTILAASFFKYINTRGEPINKIEDVTKYINGWLKGVDQAYFNRDWQMKGQKKDIPGIRENWATLWEDYRESPGKLPQARTYKKAAG
jgi:hypothetical protein